MQKTTGWFHCPENIDDLAGRHFQVRDFDRKIFSS
jgi:hypothetical protein